MTPIVAVVVICFTIAAIILGIEKWWEHNRNHPNVVRFTAWWNREVLLHCGDDTEHDWRWAHDARVWTCLRCPAMKESRHE